MPLLPHTSLSKKYLMALTGLGFSAFVVVHMLGNLQIFLGQDALNDYAKHLRELPYLLWPARATLLGMLILHVVTAFRLTAENRRARPVSYGNEGTVRASIASRTMLLSGVMILGFIIYHLMHFTLGMIHPEYFHVIDAQGREDVYARVVRSFQVLPISAAYIAAMVPLCMHLSHGLSSFPQSLGWDTMRMRPWINYFAGSVSLLVFIGNCSIPLAVLGGWIRMPY